MQKLGKSLSFIAFSQSLGVLAYCLLIAGLFNFLNSFFIGQPRLLASVFILSLLVFSVAVMGLMIFGYPVYLVIVNKEIKDALLVLIYTLLYILGLLMIIIIIMANFS